MTKENTSELTNSQLVATVFAFVFNADSQFIHFTAANKHSMFVSAMKVTTCKSLCTSAIRKIFPSLFRSMSLFST